MKRIIICGLAVALLSPTIAIAQPKGDIAKRVDTHLRRGIEFYAEKQYELAIVEFRAGYALDPRPDFLFALAQAERLSGDCPSAVVYYERYLKTNPGTNQSEAARVNMRRCSRALESAPEHKKKARSTDAELASAEKASRPAPPPVAPPPVIQPRAESLSSPAWYRDAPTVSLLGGTALSLAVGVGFWMAKSSAESAAAAATNDITYNSELDRARRNRNISLIGFGLGAVLAATTTYRYLSVRRSAERRTTISATPTNRGAAVVLSGSF